MADIAWKEVDTTMIHNCWIKSNILLDTLLESTSGPFTTLSITVFSLLNGEAKVSNALSHLEEIGVCQHNNQMDISELLNPANEDKMFNNGTEQEIEKDIYKAVLE
ncbi:hypothetical protein C0989_002462 [Termitomyces sp. Mn162]|nr:hypothetical protein C0989_002462 [Termitomyces sp. Mn162]